MIEDDSVTIFFTKAKNDQFYAGSSCSLAVLGPDHFMCPKLMFESYFSVMKFLLSPGQKKSRKTTLDFKKFHVKVAIIVLYYFCFK